MANPIEAGDELKSAVGNSEQQLASDSILHSDIPPSSKQLQKENPSEEEGPKEEVDDGTEKNKVKSRLMISGVMIAVIGAMVAIIKRMRNA